MSIDNRGRLLFEAIQQLGWGEDAAAISERVAGLERGLPAEDEFSVLVPWLGRCRLIHKLDQDQHPRESRSEYQVPDLFAVFEVQGRSIPVFIEVKTSQRNRLSWKPTYVEALQAYGELTNTPVLIAWKWGSFWTLFELRHFRRTAANYKIDFSAAMRQTLLGLLAGDFMFRLRPGVGVNISARKVLQETENSWSVVVDEAYFTDGEGGRHSAVSGLMPLLMCMEPQDTVEETETHVVQKFLMEHPSNAEFAHRALVLLVDLFAASEPLIWRSFLRDRKPPAATQNLPERVLGLRPLFVEPLLNIMPSEVPLFIS